jgi:uncharacterized protein
MNALKREADTPEFVPDYTAESLKDIDFERLQKKGVKYIAFDADSTLVPFRGRKLQEPVKELLISKKHLFKKWCIASNRPFNDLQKLGRSIDAVVIRSGLISRKPWKRYFNRVINFFGAKRPEQIAMIGDKLIADMWGAKKMGMITIWVDKIGQDNPLDRLFRVRQHEKRLMRKFLENLDES